MATDLVKIGGSHEVASVHPRSANDSEKSVHPRSWGTVRSSPVVSIRNVFLPRAKSKVLNPPNKAPETCVGDISYQRQFRFLCPFPSYCYSVMNSLLSVSLLSRGLVMPPRLIDDQDLLHPTGMGAPKGSWLGGLVFHWSERNVGVSLYVFCSAANLAQYPRYAHRAPGPNPRQRWCSNTRLMHVDVAKVVTLMLHK